MTGVAVVFPGQGSQYPGMADAWSEHPAGNDLLTRASGTLGWDVVETSRDPDALKRTDIVQPAVFACDLAAFAVLRAEGVPSGVVAGHDRPDYTALVAPVSVGLAPGLSSVVV